MQKSIQNLLEIAGEPFTDAAASPTEVRSSGLLALLSRKNGFFAFESALRVFPTSDTSYSYGLDTWNSQSLWMNSYEGLANGLFCFAEDIFGTQFCLKGEEVFTFDPETAELSLMSNDLDGWAASILSDYDVLTGYSLAHEWQSAYGLLAPRDRLMPKLPFVCGGEFSLQNLSATDAARSMRCRANLAKQIHRLRDGAQIKFELVD